MMTQLIGLYLSDAECLLPQSRWMPQNSLSTKTGCLYEQNRVRNVKRKCGNIKQADPCDEISNIICLRYFQAYTSVAVAAEVTRAMKRAIKERRGRRTAASWGRSNWWGWHYYLLFSFLFVFIFELEHLIYLRKHGSTSCCTSPLAPTPLTSLVSQFSAGSKEPIDNFLPFASHGGLIDPWNISIKSVVET